MNIQDRSSNSWRFQILLIQSTARDTIIQTVPDTTYIRYRQYHSSPPMHSVVGGRESKAMTEAAATRATRRQLSWATHTFRKECLADIPTDIFLYSVHPGFSSFKSWLTAASRQQR
jgi:hypothetical protein